MPPAETTPGMPPLRLPPAESELFCLVDVPLEAPPPADQLSDWPLDQPEDSPCVLVADWPWVSVDDTPCDWPLDVPSL